MAAQADGKVGDHAALDKLLLHELARQRDCLPTFKLERQRQLDLARELRGPAFFGSFGSVPQFLTFAHPGWRVRRPQDFCERRAIPAIRTDVQAPPPIIEPFPAAPGGYRDRALAPAATDDPDLEVVNRHRRYASPLARGPRHCIALAAFAGCTAAV